MSHVNVTMILLCAIELNDYMMYNAIAMCYVYTIKSSAGRSDCMLEVALIFFFKYILKKSHCCRLKC